MGQEHDRAGDLLAQLRAATAGYAPSDSACRTFRALYDGVEELERRAVPRGARAGRPGRLTMLQQGDHVPHFTVPDAAGASAAYSRVWQRKHLVLVRLRDPSPSAMATLADALASIEDEDTALIVTRGDIDGIPGAGVLIADRWGEIVFAAHAERDSDLPDADEIREWVRYVRMKCPECEGEAH